MSQSSAKASALPTNAREALASRALTLGTLTAAGAIRGGGAELAGSLHAGWLAERRLIERILAETAAEQSVFATLDHWEDRTRAFQQRSGTADAAWSDKQGERWRADQVLSLILDLRDRLSAWQEKGPAASATVATAASAAPMAANPAVDGDSAATRPSPIVP